MRDLKNRETLRTTITRYSASALGCLLSVLVLLEFLQVTLRYLFGQGLFWANDVSLLLLLSLGWLGAAHLWLINQHLIVSVLDKWLKPYHPAIEVLTDLLAILGTIYLLPKFAETIKLYSQIELSALPFSVAAIYIPPLIGIILIGISAAYKLATATRNSFTTPGSRDRKTRNQNTRDRKK